MVVKSRRHSMEFAAARRAACLALVAGLGVGLTEQAVSATELAPPELGLPHYEIDAELDIAGLRVVGRSRVVVTNTTAQAIGEVTFLLTPDAASPRHPLVSATGVTVEGTALVPAQSTDPARLRVVLPEPIAVGAELAVDVDFETRIPVDVAGQSSLFSYDSFTEQLYLFASWYPALEAVSPDSASTTGVRTMATYDATLRVRGGVSLMSTGELVSTERGGRGMSAYHITSGPARELAVAAGEILSPTETTRDGRTMRVWSAAWPDEPHLAEQWAGGYALDVLRRLEHAYTSYPLDDVDLLVDALWVGGASSSGLVAVNESDFSGLGYEQISEADPGFYSAAMTIAHELAHQWWGAIVASDPARDEFLREGLSDATAIALLAEQFGRNAAIEQLEQDVVMPYLQAAADGDQPVIGGPDTDAFVYSKAALGLLALRVAMGDTNYEAALSEYAVAHRFGVSTAADLLTALEQHAPVGVDARAIWEKWFLSATVTASDVDDLVNQYAATITP